MNKKLRIMLLLFKPLNRQTKHCHSHFEKKSFINRIIIKTITLFKPLYRSSLKGLKLLPFTKTTKNEK